MDLQDLRLFVVMYLYIISFSIVWWLIFEKF
jgi:hypothetical protein